MKTINEEKEVFVSFDKKDKLEAFCKILAVRFNINLSMYTHNKCSIFFVKETDYFNALSKGSLLAQEMDLSGAWYDCNNVKQPLGYIPVMYCILPQARKGDRSWTFKNYVNPCPEDIKKYISDLKEFLVDKDVALSFNQSDNAFTFFVKAPFLSHNLVSKQCKGFNYVVEKNPFIETYYPSWNNDLDVDFDKIMSVRKEKIQSYFDNSLFLDGIRHPEGANICYHCDDKPKKTSKYRRGQRSYGTNSLKRKVNLERGEEYKALVTGTFEVFEGKEYILGNYKETKDCVTIDKGDFVSEVLIEEQSVKLKTTSEVDRTITGKNYEAVNIRDGIFANFPNETGKGNVEITEYYKLISNGTRLLHYSDYNDFFEIFEVPTGWLIENGIEDLDVPKVFDDYEFDEYDKDLAEVSQILNSRKTNSTSKVLYKK